MSRPVSLNLGPDVRRLLEQLAARWTLRDKRRWTLREVAAEAIRLAAAKP